MVSERYWKVIVRYGHLGIGREVSVARFICTKLEENIMDAYKIVEQMPGVKNKGIQYISEISGETFLIGKFAEREDFFLKCLKTYKPEKNREKDSIAA